MKEPRHPGERLALIVSPQYPPSTLAGVHRARHMAKHLPSHGWRPIVVRVDERDYAERADPALGALSSAEVEQVRVRALPASLCRLAGIGDIGLRAYGSIGGALDRLISERRPAVVFFTGFPFYPVLHAARLKPRFGVPIVLDFQDPWVSAHGASEPAFSKAGLAHRLAAMLEPRAVRAADFITSVSEVQNDQMAARYPWLDRSRMAAIPIGGDPEDFEALRLAPPGEGTHRLAAGFINLTYVGTFLPRAEPLVRTLFKALADLRVENPDLAHRLKLNFVGTSNQPNDAQSYRVTPIAREEGIADLVAETPQRVPYLEALSLLANSDGLLLIGSDEPHYTASKIYPALMSGRPYLSLFHKASSAHAILTASRGGLSFGFESAEGLADLRADLARALVTLATQPQTLGSIDADRYAPYTARAVAGRFAAIFDEVGQ